MADINPGVAPETIAQWLANPGSIPARLTPVQATALVLDSRTPLSHSEVVARVGPDVAWNAGAMRFERVKVTPDLTATELVEAGVAEPVNPKPADSGVAGASSSSARRRTTRGR